MKSACPLRRLWLFCIVAIFALFLFVEVRGQCLQHHKSLLLEFKSSLVISETILYRSGKSSKLANWTLSTDCCLWPGVTCSGAYVTGIDLSDEGIVVGLNDTSSLFDLTSLTSLNLAKMYQKTVIPPGIGRLVNLIHLDMFGSSFMGQIPREISNLTRLVSLNFSKCDTLKVENPNLRMLVGNLSNLINLSLSEVDLSSQSRDWCQALMSSTPRLQVLELSDSGMSGLIHDSLQNLTHLSVHDLSFNNFSSPIPYGVFLSLKNLTSLTLKYCEINEVLPLTVLQLPTLRYLDVSWNHFPAASSSINLQNSSLETLILSGTRLWKTIPESIGEARVLSHLELRLCNLSGEIPKLISQLEHLVHLDMSENNLDGYIPSFSRSRNLTFLDLSSNRLNGSMLATDWRKLHKMENLKLQSNHLSGSIPACLFQTPSLLKLNLEGNHFTGFTNESNVMTFLSNLVELNLRDNDLQGPFPPFIYGLNSLQNLDLSFNNLSETFSLDSLVQFSQLYTLGLASCSLKEFPPFLTNKSSLASLDLSDNQIDGSISKQIWNMSNLMYLNLSNNQLAFWEREELSVRLEILDLSSNNFHGSVPESICSITYLSIVDLSNNFFRGTLPQCLTKLPVLSILNLRKNNINGVIPDLSASCVLNTFDLSQNSFQGKIPKSLGGCHSLEVLDLGYNKLHDRFPCWMNNVDMLTIFILRSNSLYGNIQCLNNNFNWTKLQIMDIASNKFDGNLTSVGLLRWETMMVDNLSATSDLQYLQQYFMNLIFTNTALVTIKGYQRNLTKISTAYTLVDFSDNKFEGDIPYEMGELKFLYALNLSHNCLSGRIPPSFRNLYRIESLDLSKNELSGKIPEQLATLTSLSILNLSFNRLEGMVPKGSQFQTFTEASFMGNEGLCGQPLSTSCWNVDESNPPNSSSEAENEFRDILIATQVGYTLGFGLIIMPLIFWSAWRKRYYECIDRVIFCCQPKIKKSPLPKKTRRRS